MRSVPGRSSGPGRPGRRRKAAAARLRRLATAVRDADRLREAVFRAAPDAIVISDAEGRVREVNAAAEVLFARPAAVLVGCWMSDLVSSSDPGRVRGGNMLATLGQRVALDGRGAGEARFPAEITVQRVGVGRRTRYAAYIRDLSGEQRAATVAEAQRQHLAEIEKLSAMGSLLSGVAHELNNPLAIVAAQATVLRDKAPDEDVARRADRIQAAAQRAGRIVKSFTALATRRPAVREPLALADAFAEARELVGFGLRRADIAVKEEFPAELPQVAGDRDLIVQVFAALLLNAQEALASRDGERRISVRAVERDAGVAVEIADNGPGVAPSVSERLFEPYVTTKPAGSGLGIGLSLCRSVLGQHGGTVTHRSDATGAAFTVVVPRAVIQSAQADTPVRAAGLRVLVVDDAIEVARSLAELIEILGHSVGVATSAEDALARLETNIYDMVFTDYHMPGLDGAALRDRIARQHPALASRIVLVTGDKRHQSGPARAGARVLAKPFTAADVQAVLAQPAAP